MNFYVIFLLSIILCGTVNGLEYHNGCPYEFGAGRMVFKCGGSILTDLPPLNIILKESITHLETTSRSFKIWPLNICEYKYIKKIIMVEQDFVAIPSTLFSCLTLLEEIEITRSRLNKLGDGMLSGLQNMKKIILRNNEINSVGTNVFDPMNHDSISLVDLSDNRLTSIDLLEFFVFKEDAIVKLNNNQISNFINPSGRSLSDAFTSSHCPVDLSNNYIKDFGDKLLTLYRVNNFRLFYDLLSDINLSNNPITCTCAEYQKTNIQYRRVPAFYLTEGLKTMQCSTPSEHRTKYLFSFLGDTETEITINCRSVITPPVTLPFGQTTTPPSPIVFGEWWHYLLIALAALLLLLAIILLACCCCCEACCFACRERCSCAQCCRKKPKYNILHSIDIFVNYPTEETNFVTRTIHNRLIKEHPERLIYYHNIDGVEDGVEMINQHTMNSIVSPKNTSTEWKMENSKAFIIVVNNQGIPEKIAQHLKRVLMSGEHFVLFLISNSVVDQADMEEELEKQFPYNDKSIIMEDTSCFISKLERYLPNGIRYFHNHPTKLVSQPETKRRTKRKRHRKKIVDTVTEHTTRRIFPQKRIDNYY